MRDLKTVVVITSLVVISLPSVVKAEMATQDEALTVANSWIAWVIAQEGAWAGSDSAEVLHLEPFMRGDRVLGYFCRVKPAGYIIVSLYKELAPINTYSAESNLVPDSEEGMADFLKVRMIRTLHAIEESAPGLRTTAATSASVVFEIDYRPAWDLLLGNAGSSGSESGSLRIGANYAGGDPPLLSSNWHQLPPYNDQCPELHCNWCQYVLPCCGYSTRAPVGCAALSISQLMRYWAWPPYGEGDLLFTDEYAWKDMPDVLELSPANCTGSAAQIGAVTELCYEAGVALNSVYGCSRTDASGLDQLNGLKNNFRYAGASLDGYDQFVNFASRNAYTAVEWFRLMKEALAKNRVVLYNIPNHGVVIDGWKETTAGMQYHVNYGMGDNQTAWLAVDAIPGGSTEDDYIFPEIRPQQALGSQLAGSYVRSATFPYRYFDRDTTGGNATFASGQNLQFLPRVCVRCTAGPTGSIEFLGDTSQPTRLFSFRGTPTGMDLAGIRISGGVVRLYQNGSIRFH